MMQTKTGTRTTQMTFLTRMMAVATATAAALMVAGCGAGFTGVSNSAPVSTGNLKLQGSVHGGQQPVTGSTIQLYAANLTGYGASSYALLTTGVTTDANGNFSITGDYTCPTPSTPVYLEAAGGNSGSGTNTGLALMTAFATCGTLQSTAFVSINELTTVASAYALAPFMSSPTQLGTSTTNITGLANALASVTKLVNTSTGQTPGSTLPTGATEPVAELDTLADILAACVNSMSGSVPCNNLFTNATPAGGAAPTDTITAILDIAKNPGHNVTALYNSAGSTPPFQPTLASTPSDFTVALKYAPTGIFSTPSAAALTAGGDLWVTNSGNNTITALNATTALPTIYTGGGLSGPSGIAFDKSGNAWVTELTSSKLSVFTPSGVGTQTVVSGLNTPTAVAIDGQGLIWVTSSGNNSVVMVGVNGTTPTSSQNYTNVGGINTPVAIAINPH